MPTAVTMVLFSLLVNAWRALDAKLGSAVVRPRPVTIDLGGIFAIMELQGW